MKLRTSLAVGSLLAAVAWPSLACYTVYGLGSRVLYQSMDAPVDMSQPLHDTLPQRFPGGQLVFDAATTCTEIAPVTQAARVPGPAPLLTDRHTAQALHVPYTVMSHNIVMVPPEASMVARAALPSPIMVVPHENVAAAAAAPRQETVITELHNPPMTIIEGPSHRVTMGSR